MYGVLISSLMHILITGGAGFIGTNLSKYLLAQGHNITCVDSLITGQKKNVDMLGLVGKEKFEFIQMDVISDSFRDLKFSTLDWVINLACPASPPKYQADPIHTLLTCMEGTRNSLEITHKFGAKLLHASTSEVYGDPDHSPQAESYRGNVNTVGVRSCYDEGKRVAETLCYEYSRQYRVDARIVRIFNTYGPHMDIKDGRVVTNFISQALSGALFTIYGDGNQTRSFQYIDDLVAGIVSYMNTEEPFLGPVNLGNPEEFTINQLLQEVKSITNSTSSTTFLPGLSDDPLQRCPDISLASAKLGWTPRVKLREGLIKTIDHFRLPA